MNHYPYLGPKDRKLAGELVGSLMRYSHRVSNPRIKASLSQWAMMLRESMKVPRPESR